MTNILIRQGNGKLCLANTISPDQWSKDNLTDDEFIQIRVNEAIAAAKEEIAHAQPMKALKDKFYPTRNSAIDELENLLKRTGDAPLTNAERKRFEDHVIFEKETRESYAGYFK